MLHFLWRYGLLVLTLATSIGSYLWGLGEALPQTPTSAIGWFTVSYVCMVAAAAMLFLMQRKEMQELKTQLEGRGITDARRSEAESQLAKLTHEEQVALRVLHAAHRLSGRQTHARFPDVNFNAIHQKTSFLDLSGIGELSFR